jgi:hypothetical protein
VATTREWPCSIASSFEDGPYLPVVIETKSTWKFNNLVWARSVSVCVCPSKFATQRFLDDDDDDD